MKKSFTILLFALFGWVAKSHACHCGRVPTFCESIIFGNNGLIGGSRGVYAGTVSTINESEVELLIQETYFGEFNTSQTITLVKGDGGNCIELLYDFEIGDTYIIAAYTHPDSTRWWLSQCEVSYLKVQNGEVIGSIAPGVSTVSLAEFASQANCGSLDGFSLKVNPTLTSNEVNITTDLLSPGPIQVTVFDAAGRLVYQTKEPAFDQDKIIVLDMEAWAAGMYFVRWNYRSRQKTVKIVKIGV